MTTLRSEHNADGLAVSWTLHADSGPYLHDCLSVFPQAGQVLSGPQAPHCPGQTLQDRRSSPVGQAWTLHLVEFIAFCQYFKRILQGETEDKDR